MQNNGILHTDQVLEEIRQIITEIPGGFLAGNQIRPEHRLREDLGLDSLAMVDLMVAVEDTLGISFDPTQMDLDTAFETVSSLTHYIITLTTE